MLTSEMEPVKSARFDHVFSLRLVVKPLSSDTQPCFYKQTPVKLGQSNTYRLTLRVSQVGDGTCKTRHRRWNKRCKQIGQINSWRSKLKIERDQSNHRTYINQGKFHYPIKRLEECSSMTYSYINAITVPHALLCPGEIRMLVDGVQVCLAICKCLEMSCMLSKRMGYNLVSTYKILNKQSKLIGIISSHTRHRSRDWKRLWTLRHWVFGCTNHVSSS